MSRGFRRAQAERHSPVLFQSFSMREIDSTWRGCGGARGDPGPAALLPGYPCGPSPGPLHLPAQTRVASGFPPSLQLQRPQARGSRLGTRRAREPPETGYLGDSCCGGGGSSSSVDVSRQL